MSSIPYILVVIFTKKLEGVVIYLVNVLLLANKSANLNNPCSGTSLKLWELARPEELSSNVWRELERERLEVRWADRGEGAPLRWKLSNKTWQKLPCIISNKEMVQVSFFDIPIHWQVVSLMLVFHIYLHYHLRDSVEIVTLIEPLPIKEKKNVIISPFFLSSWPVLTWRISPIVSVVQL